MTDLKALTAAVVEPIRAQHDDYQTRMDNPSTLECSWADPEHKALGTLLAIVDAQADVTEQAMQIPWTGSTDNKSIDYAIEQTHKAVAAVEQKLRELKP